LREESVWVIEPRGEGILWRLREVFRYRYLIGFFGLRTVSQMFRGTALRPLWLLMRVTGPIGLSAVVFGAVLKVPSEGLPYFLFFLAGMAPWTVFEMGAIFVTRSIERNRRLITKVYFPRLILPIASLSFAVLELVVILLALAATLGYHMWVDGVWYARTDPGLLFAALAILGSLVFALAFGLWTSVLQARYRDVRYTLRYGMRFWFYFTPVIYPLSQIPEKWRWLAYLNPMTPIVEGFKWGVFGIGSPSVVALAMGGTLIVATLVGGLWFFLTAEANAVDKL
jgi:lipopolysaccharide transport system permease protein